MPFLLLKDLPRYECLLEAAKEFPELDPSACEVFLHLLRVGDQAFGMCDGYLQQHNLSQGRFTVLMLLLNKANGCPQAHTPAELAEMGSVTRATMTGLVDSLERDGLVTRQPDPVDRRMLSVALTEKGLGFLRGVLPGHFRGMAALMAPLNETERRTLVGLLTKISAQAETLKAQRAAAASSAAQASATAASPSAST